MRNAALFRVELYFVLYLVALLLLLFEPPSPEGATAPVAQPPGGPSVEFSLRPSELLCLIEDSAGKRILRSYDSTAELWYSRPLEQPSLFVQLDSAGHILWHSGQSSESSPITVEPRLDERRFLIHWHFPWWKPALTVGQHVYRLRIQVQHGRSDERYNEYFSALLRINVITPSISLQATSSAQPPLQSPLSLSPAPLRVMAPNSEIEAPPNGDWESELIVYGVDLLRELASEPKITITGAVGGNATARAQSPTTLVVRGTAPREGTLRVSVTLVRRA
ncbi:MAG: hypothetical protein NZ949_05220, partial [Candidatus Kapabacteria bacterium]|nr:hypothetical protein [Candidatus Kapabacteria bacterium]